MTFSINKIEKLLKSRGFVIQNFFVSESICIYIEIFDSVLGSTFMLYIPSKYDIIIQPANNVHEIKSIDVNSTDDLHTDKDDDYDDIDFSPDILDKKLKEHLDDNYKHDISLSNNDDKTILCTINRQLSRIVLSVQNIKYKICIMIKNYIGCIKRDNSIDFYSSQLYTSDELKLKVSIDLEMLLKNLDNISSNIKKVNTDIIKILDKNHVRHTKNLKKLLEMKHDVQSFSDQIYSKKEKFRVQLTNLYSSLDKLLESETQNVDKIMTINDHYKKNGGIHSDVERIQSLTKYEKELDRIRNLKHEIYKNIHIIKTKLEHITLKTDNILFDNTIMLNSIINNIISLQNL